TTWHLDNMAKVMLASGLVVAYGYLMEGFMAFYGVNLYDQFDVIDRAVGPYAVLFWGLMLCNVLAPQALWSRSVRTSPIALLVVATFINVGMWLERFVIVVASLSRDYLPSAWGLYAPTIWDVATFVGSLGLFVCFLYLFSRFLPMVAVFEVRQAQHR